MLAIPFMSTRAAGFSGNFRLRIPTFPPRTLSLPKQVEFLEMLCCIQKTKQIAAKLVICVRCQLVRPPARPGPVRPRDLSSGALPPSSHPRPGIDNIRSECLPRIVRAPALPHYCDKIDNL